MFQPKVLDCPHVPNVKNVSSSKSNITRRKLVHSYPGNCLIRFVNRISIACQKFQFSKIPLVWKFWKSENSSLKFKFYQISTAIQTKIKTTFGRFQCHLICLNLKSRLEGLWYGEYENDGVKNGTKVRTYETLVNFGQFQTGIKPQIEFHYAEFWNI